MRTTNFLRRFLFFRRKGEHLMICFLIIGNFHVQTWPWSSQRHERLKDIGDLYSIKTHNNENYIMLNKACFKGNLKPFFNNALPRQNKNTVFVFCKLLLSNVACEVMDLNFLEEMWFPFYCASNEKLKLFQTKSECIILNVKTLENWR